MLKNHAFHIFQFISKIKTEGKKSGFSLKSAKQILQFAQVTFENRLQNNSFTIGQNMRFLALFKN